MSTFIERRDKPELKKIIVTFQLDKLCVEQWCIYWRNSESHRQCLLENLEKYQCNSREFQRGGKVVVVLREEKAFIAERRREKNFTSRTKLCCFKEPYLILVGGNLFEIVLSSVILS